MTTKTNKSSNRCFIICGGQGLAVSYYLIICRGPGLVVISPWSRVGVQRTKLPKQTFRARLPRNFSDQASKTSVSREASSKFLRPSFQHERFTRDFLTISQNKLPKRTFCARLPPNFTEPASKTNVSREASSKFQRTSFQKERFVRGFLKFSQNKLPKRTFRARLPPNFTEQVYKTNVCARLPQIFIKQSFQNERFVRGFLKFSKNKLSKRTFRAKLLQIFTEQTSKTNVSHETSSKFHRTSLQNERFARDFLKF